MKEEPQRTIRHDDFTAYLDNNPGCHGNDNPGCHSNDNTGCHGNNITGNTTSCLGSATFNIPNYSLPDTSSSFSSMEQSPLGLSL